MTLATANAIRSWRYPPPYDFYHLTVLEEYWAGVFRDRLA